MTTDKKSFQESGKFFVKGAGHLGFDAPRQRLTAGERFDDASPSEARLRGFVFYRFLIAKEGGKYLTRIFTFWNKFPIHERPHRKQEKMPCLGLRKSLVFTHQGIPNKRFRRFGVVGDAFDGLFHDGIRMEFSRRGASEQFNLKD